MKKLILIISIIACALHTSAQTGFCNLKNQPPQPRIVFIFSEQCNYSIMELFGEQVPLLMLNIMYVPNEERKKEIDEWVLQGNLYDSIFIFPEATGMRRYCNPQEYAAYLKSEKFLPAE